MRRLTLIVVCVIIVLFVWYIAADRFAPWTDEARVQRYFVPIVAEVSGRVLAVNVDNDQVVKTGEALLHIDARNYGIAVRRAQAALDTAVPNAERVRKREALAQAKAQVSLAALVAIAGLYVVGALSVLEHVWPPPDPATRS